MPKKKLLNVVIIIVLGLAVPFLIARLTGVILEATYPSASPSGAGNRNVRATTSTRELDKMKAELDEIEARSEVARKGLERTRAMTRIALVVVGIYYVVLISGWIILRRRKRKLSPAA
jgi:hypothetical protein